VLDPLEAAMTGVTVLIFFLGYSGVLLIKVFAIFFQKALIVQDNGCILNIQN